MDVKPMKLVYGTGLPLYYQLREHLRTAITTLPPDTQVPTERELMELAKVSRATARRALADLVQEGLLVARQGAGTFTAPTRIRAELGKRPLGFTEAVRRAGGEPQTQVLDAQEVPAPPNIAGKLAIPPGAPVYVLDRLRLIGNQPAMVERAYLSVSLVPGLTSHGLAGSLYETLEQQYGLAAASGEETILAVNADLRQAKLLEVPLATALLATARRTYTDTGATLEYTLRHARGDACSFFVELRDTDSVMSHYSIATDIAEDLARASQ